MDQTVKERLTMEPRLYIIMREDIQDMNPGKAVAQGCHAQALFDLYNHGDNGILEPYCAWRGDGEDCLGFGVTLVLSALWEQMCDIEDCVKHTGMVVDPTYPWRNYYGKTFTTAETTCMWAFPTTEQEFEYMHQFDLHR